MKLIRLKDYVDFITTLTEMEEVKDGKFVTPKVLGFKLGEYNHRELYKEVLAAKKQEEKGVELSESFEVDILGVTLLFEHE